MKYSPQQRFGKKQNELDLDTAASITLLLLLRCVVCVKLTPVKNMGMAWFVALRHSQECHLSTTTFFATGYEKYHGITGLHLVPQGLGDPGWYRTGVQPWGLSLGSGRREESWLDREES